MLLPGTQAKPHWRRHGEEYRETPPSIGQCVNAGGKVEDEREASETLDFGVMQDRADRNLLVSSIRSKHLDYPNRK